MMNKGEPSVPIPLLGNLITLPDLLFELPLPTPLPYFTERQSLLSHLTDVEEARRILNTQESVLTPLLIDSLHRTATDIIEVKDEYCKEEPHSGQKSELLRVLIRKSHGIFNEYVCEPQIKNEDNQIPSGVYSQRQYINLSTVHPQQSNVSPCQTEDNGLNCGPLGHVSNPSGVKTSRNGNLNLPPDSPLTYSPHIDNFTPCGPNHPFSPLHCDATSQRTVDSLLTCVQDSSQVCNSSLANQHVNVLYKSPDFMTCDDNCLEEADLTDEQNDNTEKQILKFAQEISNLASKYSPITSLLNSPIDVAMPCPSSIPIPKRIDSSSSIVKNPVIVLTKLSLEDQLLAQKSVNQFSSKCKRAESHNPPKTLVQKKIFKIYNRPCSSSYKKHESCKKSIRDTSHNNEYFTSLKNSNIKDERHKRSFIASEKLSRSADSASARKKQSICSETCCIESPSQNGMEKSQFLSSPQVFNNAAPNCSSRTVLIKNSNDVSASFASSLSSSQHIDLPSVIVGPPAFRANCEQPTVEHWKFVPNNSDDNLQPSIDAKQNVNSVHNYSISEPTFQPLIILGSEPNKGNEVIQVEEPNGREKVIKPAMICENETVFVTEPFVVLPKLSLEEQLLAQKSVSQFTIERKRSGPSAEALKVLVKNKIFDTSNPRDASIGFNKEIDPSNGFRPKRRDYEYFDKNKNSDFTKDRILNDSFNTSTGNLNESGKAKKWRRICKESSDSENEPSGKFQRGKPPEVRIVTPKAKKSKDKKTKKDFAVEPLSIEDFMDSTTYQHFLRIVDVIFDSVESMDFSAVIDEDAECPSEALIPLDQLHELCTEVAKLKSLHAMNLFPKESLVRLLKILEINIMDGAQLLPVKIIDDQEEKETRLSLGLTIERLMRSADASLTALHIMTSAQMPDEVFYEDVIEKIVHFLKYQLQNTVFPMFDPAYRLDPICEDGYTGNIKQKRDHAHKIKERYTLQLYNKLHEAVTLLAELLEVQTVTDSIILQVSALGVGPFFVEGISELQLNSLRLVTTVFAHYDQHRSLILEDILASIARLPTSKMSLRSFRLNAEENIQMLTALVLQLIHSVIRLPEPEINHKIEFWSVEKKAKNTETKGKVCVDKDILIIKSYEASMKTAIGFLSVFLKKCGRKNEEMDYRPLFENFVQDLLNTVNKPEWPASELLLSLLGRILVSNFSDKSLEMTLRVASLDYLGVVAARLRKNAVASQKRKDMIKDIIQRIVTDNGDDLSPNGSKLKAVEYDEVQILQKALLQYLYSKAAKDPSFQFSRTFYIAQWYRDAMIEVKQWKTTLTIPEEESEKNDCVRSKSKQNRSRSFQVNYEKKEEEKESHPENGEVDSKALELAEKRKLFLLTFAKQEEHPKVNEREISHIDYTTAELISQYLASNRHFSQSFDLYLSQILSVLGETAVAIRTKAMKCLTLVIEADPSILARSDMQKGVHGRLLDQSICVREAAVDLLGKYILIRPELINQYYEMLTNRILDTGVSVRKRVIKILKDICVEQPDFPQTSEICVKIIRRVNDEEGIRKLVIDVFQAMWFSPVSDKKQKQILQKVKNITHVVEACGETGLEWFEQLLANLLKNREDKNYKCVVKSCGQIVDCLVENLLQIEESSQHVGDGLSPNLAACLSTLHLFTKIHPPFAVHHATTIQPYLSMKCSTQSDLILLKNVVQTLELVVPLMEHPSESFLAYIEEGIMKLILRQHMVLLSSSVSCLNSVVNKVTHNYQLVKDCFEKLFAVVLICKREYEKSPKNENLKVMRPKLLRSLYTVGLFCRHFDFDAMCPNSEQNMVNLFKERIFESVIYFNQQDDEKLRLKALTGLGFILIRHHEFMLGPEVKTLYHSLLTSPVASPLLKCQVLKNISKYLAEEDMRMIKKDSEWSKVSKSEDLKEMCDVKSGMASTVIQIYLNQILECILHTEISVRRACLSVVQLIRGQGLVHPIQIVSCLVCLGSEDDSVIRATADHLLQEIENKYTGFILMKAMFGVKMSFKLQKLIQDPNDILRGFRCLEDPVSRIGFLYSVIRSTKQSRRAFLISLTKLFDEQAGTPLTELLYIADNIAYFPYMIQDEPLFIIHKLDLILSVSGSNILQTFCEGLLNFQPYAECEQGSAPTNSDNFGDDGGDEFEAILKRLPEDTHVLQECVTESQVCILLLCVKQTLKEMYGFTDNKIQQYSPSETAKMYDRALNRKVHVRFNPETVLSFIKTHGFEGDLDELGKKNLVKAHLHFKQLMLTIDLSGDEDGDNEVKQSTTASSFSNSSESIVVDEINNDTELVQSPLKKIKAGIPQKGELPSHSRSHRKSPETLKGPVMKKRRCILEPVLDDYSSD